MSESRAVPRAREELVAGKEVRCSGRRGDEDVAVVGDARAAQVRVAEPEDRAVGIVVPRAGIPSLDAGVGAQLDHAERHGRPGIGVAVAAGAEGLEAVAVDGIDPDTADFAAITAAGGVGVPVLVLDGTGAVIRTVTT